MSRISSKSSRRWAAKQINVKIDRRSIFPKDRMLTASLRRQHPVASSIQGPFVDRRAIENEQFDDQDGAHRLVPFTPPESDEEASGGTLHHITSKVDLLK